MKNNILDNLDTIIDIIQEQDFHIKKIEIEQEKIGTSLFFIDIFGTENIKENIRNLQENLNKNGFCNDYEKIYIEQGTCSVILCVTCMTCDELLKEMKEEFTDFFEHKQVIVKNNGEDVITLVQEK